MSDLTSLVVTAPLAHSPSGQYYTELPESVTRISGTLPTQLGGLSKLSELATSGLKLSGSIPDLSVETLSYVDLLANRFDPTNQPKELMTACMAEYGQKRCRGLPPQSCLAFGKNSRMSATAIGTCKSCPGSVAPTVLLSLLCAVITYFVAKLYLRMIELCPDIKGWVATSSIVLSQLQISTVKGSLTTTEGSLFSNVAQFPTLLTLDFSLAGPECLFPPNGIGGWFNGTFLTMLILLGFLLSAFMIMGGAKWYYSRRAICAACTSAGCCSRRAVGEVEAQAFETQDNIFLGIGVKTGEAWKWPERCFIPVVRYLPSRIPFAHAARKEYRAHMDNQLSTYGMEINLEPLPTPLPRVPYPRRIHCNFVNPLYWLAAILWWIVVLLWFILSIPMAYLLPIPFIASRASLRSLLGEKSEKFQIVCVLLFPVELLYYAIFLVLQGCLGLLTLWPPNVTEFALAFDAIVELTYLNINLASPRTVLACRTAAGIQDTAPTPGSSPPPPGCVVTKVDAALSAGSAGLQVGDRIVQVGHIPVSSASEVIDKLDQISSGSPVSLMVKRRVPGVSDEMYRMALDQETADSFENKVVQVYAVLLNTLVTFAITLSLNGFVYVYLSAAIFLFVGLFGLQLWYNVMSLRFKDPLPARRSLSEKANPFKQPWLAKWVRTPMSKERLERRLKYVVKKYATHGAHWQFVVWLRQFALVAATLYVGENGDAFLQSGLDAGILVIWLLWQLSVRPFASMININAYFFKIQFSQNLMEEAILLKNIVEIGLGMSYYAARNPSGGEVTYSQLTIDIVMCIMTIVSFIFMFTVLYLGGREMLRGKAKETNHHDISIEMPAKHTSSKDQKAREPGDKDEAEDAVSAGE